MQILIGAVVASIVAFLVGQKYFSGDSSKNQNADGQKQTSESGAQNPELNFNSAAGSVQAEVQNPAEGSTLPIVLPAEDPSSPCPTRTNKYKRVLDCPRLSPFLKQLLKNSNFMILKDDCDIESRTTQITLGKHFIAWTLHQKNSCENRAYPQGLSEEKTYKLEDGAEVIFGDHFTLPNLEAFYLENVDLKMGRDQEGQKCSAPKESNRRESLGSLSSELSKAQFRFVDDGQTVNLKMQTFFEGALGRICSVELSVPKWHEYLYKDSKFQKNQKAEELFKE